MAYNRLHGELPPIPEQSRRKLFRAAWGFVFNGCDLRLSFFVFFVFSYLISRARAGAAVALDESSPARVAVEALPGRIPARRQPLSSAGAAAHDASRDALGG